MSSVPPAPSDATMRDDAIAESQQLEVSGGVHFAGLDGYRAVAALMVVITHVAFSTGVVTTTGTWGHLLGRLDFGVALFFLMSGFLLYRPWVRAEIRRRHRARACGATPSVARRASCRCTGSWS